MFNLQMSECKYKLYNLTTVNFVIYTHQPIVFPLYLYMAWEGTEKLLILI